ncbi:MAG: hypothetical protein KJ737_17530 [Proteobacteria bacterium]|nr:hypothetical protein [Pseudomonadota bacterium]
MEIQLKINNLMKVGLDVWKGSSVDNIDLDATPVQINFIFGIGSSGLSGIEYALFGKKIGEQVAVQVNPSNFHDMFSHLACQFHDITGHQNAVCLAITVTQISQADNHEIVKAMAGVDSSCGGGCDCGCG